MQTVFDQLEAEMIRQQQGVFGQRFTLTPMRARPNRAPAADATRQAFDFCGIQYTTALTDDLNKSGGIQSARRHGGFSNHNVSGKAVRVEVLLCDLMYEPVRGDKLIRVTDGVAFRINDSQPSGHSYLMLHLNEWTAQNVTS